MKQLTCEMCGSTDLLKQDGVFVCQSCGCKYSVEEAKKLMIEGTVEVQGTVAVDKANEAEALLKRAFMFLDDLDWESADSYCDKVLDIDPENSEAYLGKLMAEFEITTLEELQDCDEFFENSMNFKKALRFAENSLKNKLTNTLNSFNNNKGAEIRKRQKIADQFYYTGHVCYGFCITGIKDSTVKHIDIPNFTQTIEAAAFKGCSELESINIPDNVKSINAYAFKGCTSLISITIPNTVTYIGPQAFCDCENLTTVTLPNNLSEISQGTFQNCEKLANISIPSHLTKIGADAFQYCYNLQNISLPNTISAIHQNAFEFCTNLKSINIPNKLTSIRFATFVGCSSLENIIIPDSVTEIESQAFNGCSNLSRIDIPEGIVTINSHTFSECSNLREISLPSTICSIEDFAFADCANLSKITIGNAEIRVEKLESKVGIRIETIYRIPEYPHIKISMGAFVRCGSCVKLMQLGATPTSSTSNTTTTSTTSGCYVATCVYGSYDCPQVWTLRRFRDDTLGSTWYGRLFIRAYYAVSPTLVKWFGKTNWFKKLWRGKLDRMVAKLQSNGVEDTPYQDKEW